MDMTTEDEDLVALWALVDDPASTAAQVWDAWVRIREILANQGAADGG